MGAGFQTQLGFDQLQLAVCQDPYYWGLKDASANRPQFVTDVLDHAIKRLHQYGEALAQAISSQYRTSTNGERFLPHPDGSGALFLDGDGHLVKVVGARFTWDGKAGGHIELAGYDYVQAITGPNAGQVIALQTDSAPVPAYSRGVVAEWVRQVKN